MRGNLSEFIYETRASSGRFQSTRVMPAGARSPARGCVHFTQTSWRRGANV